MSTEAYSLVKDGDKLLSENFRVREFRCKDGSNTIFIDSDLVALLQHIRNHFNRPVVITSAYRTVTHNKAVGGSPKSQHLYGMAADIQVADTPPEFVAQYAETLLPGTGGIGVYPKKKGRAKGWVHVDVRKTKARWSL